MTEIIVFDLDDTLFPESEFVLSGFRAVDQWVLQKYSVFGFYEAARQLFADGLRGKIFNTALEQLEIQYDTALIEKLVGVYRSHKPNIKLFEDSLWAINYFKANKKLAIITDGFLDTQRNKIEALNIGPYFNKIIYSDEYGRDFWKPSQKPYLKLMEFFECKGSECVYIGDNPAKDFLTAKKLGWKTIRVCRINGEYSNIDADCDYEADFNITALFELEKLIDKN